MLDEVLSEVVLALQRQGVPAVRDFAESCYEGGTVLCVGAEKCRCLSSGLGDYLGVRHGAGGAQDVELYGRRLELVLSFEAFCGFEEGAGACQALAGALSGLLELLPEGICKERLETGEVRADREAECFRCRSLLFCTAFLVAESSADEGEFLDFKLKGRVTNVC